MPPDPAKQICVSGSVANLGPGFDTLAVAIQLFLRLNVTLLPGTGELRFTGTPPADENCIARAFLHAAGDRAPKLPSMAVAVESEIPMKAGLGSSAGATVAGLRLFEFARGQELPDAQLLAMAAQLEGHADNVAASLLGGLAICCENSGGRVDAVTVAWPSELRLLVITPEVPLATSAARAVLPASLSRADAVHNLQRVAMLLAALQTRDWGRLRCALQDRLHQPYREALVPGLPELLALQHSSVLGVFLSGAGPSIVALVADEADTARRLVEERYGTLGVSYTTRLLDAHSPSPQR